jgi:hypothetical protein
MLVLARRVLAKRVPQCKPREILEIRGIPASEIVRDAPL